MAASMGPRARWAVVFLASGVWSEVARANPDIFVAPRRPGQTNVRHFDFDWQTIHILTEPGPDGEPRSGVEMYFYERERDVAERAAVIVADAYLELGERFGAYPDSPFPFVLYSSYQEFLRTNLFPLGEGVLGVTSTRDLTLTLPWFGDERLFEDVFTHELAHQFMIQEVQGAGRRAKTYVDPLQAMPLWFVEGLAEFYAQDGLDDEAHMVALDLAVNADPDRGYGLHPFFEDRPWDVRWTYKMGQVRCVFLEETYGEGTLQTILERSPRLVGTMSQRGTRFDDLLGMVTGDEPDEIEAKFATWLKRGAYQTWLDAEQKGPDLEPVDDVQHAEAIAASPSGEVLLLRAYDPERGVSRLTLVDPRQADDGEIVAIDNRPGVESLHPVSGQSFDLSDEDLVYVAESRGRDVLYVQSWRHEAKERVSTDAHAKIDWDVRFKVGKRRGYELVEEGLVGAFSPSFSPDGERIAFIGLDMAGDRDVYVLEPGRGGDYTLTRLTNDPFSERQLDWGPEGIVYSSSATEHGYFNLFRVDPDGSGAITRLTAEARDHEAPVALRDGGVVFQAWADGRSNLYEAVEGAIVQRTDVATGVFMPTAAPGDDLWVLQYEGGRRRPTRVVSFVDAPPIARQADGEAPEAPPRASLAAAEPYQGLKPGNWGIDGIFGFAGGGSGGIYGQLLMLSSDTLRNHMLTLDVAMYGTPALTDGYLLYANQARRVTWGAGPFHFLRYRFDDVQEVEFLSIERFYGGVATARYPLNRFMYVQGDVAVGGATGFLFDSTAAYLADPDVNGTGEDLLAPWLKEHGDVELQTEATARIGYDTVGYHVRTGPLTGGSLLLESTLGVRPIEGRTYANMRADAARFFPIVNATNFYLQAGAGTTFGELAQRWWLQSTDTLRGVPFGDPAWLVGRHYAFGTAELQVPLDAVVRLAFISNVEAVGGFDVGAVADAYGDLWDRRVVDGVIGTNVILGSMVFRLHFARPIDVGAPLPTGPESRWVTNLSLDWLYG